MCQIEDFYHPCCRRPYPISALRRCRNFNRGASQSHVLELEGVRYYTTHGDTETTENRVRFKLTRVKAKLLKKYKVRSCFTLSQVERPTTLCDDCLDMPEDGVLWSIRSLFEEEEEEEEKRDDAQSSEGEDKSDVDTQD